MADFPGDMCLWLLFFEEGDVSFPLHVTSVFDPLLAALPRFSPPFRYIFDVVAVGLWVASQPLLTVVLIDAGRRLGFCSSSCQSRRLFDLERRRGLASACPAELLVVRTARFLTPEERGF